jgi:hypothetical protein
LIIAACTGVGARDDPITPPDVFAPTPTIGDESSETTSTSRPATTTTLDVERGEILKVDPLTLEPLPGHDPIPMGDWMWGQPSPNGSYFAAFAGDEYAGSSEIRLIDVANWRLEQAWRGFPESELHVTDDGTIYVVSFGQIHRLQPGINGSEEVARLPASFQPWFIGRIIGEDLVTVGTRGVSDQAEQLSIVSIGITTETVTEIALPDVHIGPAESSSGEPLAEYLYIYPSVVWDEAGRRALVAHGDENVISEVDLESGIVSEHTFESTGAANGTPTPFMQRSAAISPDGRRVYLSGRAIVDAATDDETRKITTAPLGVISIDTTTWQVVAEIADPVAEVHPSPDGSRIIGWGYSTEEGETIHSTESTGLYVLDSATLDIVAQYPPESQIEWYGPVTFNEEAGTGYVTVWRARARVLVIDLDSGQTLASVEGGDTLNMFGSIGVLNADAGAVTP